MGGPEKRVDAGWWPEEPYSIYLPLRMVHGPLAGMLLSLFLVLVDQAPP